MTSRFFCCLFCGNLICETTFTTTEESVTKFKGKRKVRRVARTGQSNHAEDCPYRRATQREIERKEVRMGLFDKDKLFAPDGPLMNWVDDDTEFILWDIELLDGTVSTDLGEAPMVHLTVSTLEAPESRDVVSMIGDLAAKRASEKEDGDLPAIVKTMHVPTDKGNDAYVFKFSRPYEVGAEAAA